MSAPGLPSKDDLIAIEWDTVQGLKKRLADPEISPTEAAHLSNALAYHMTVLNKLQNERGERSQFSDATLGDFIKNLDAKMFMMIRRDFKFWTKKLSSKKSRRT